MLIAGTVPLLLKRQKKRFGNREILDASILRRGFVMKAGEDDLLKIREYFGGPTFTILQLPERVKQSDSIFSRAMRGEFGPGLQKMGITTQ
jgi:hypothetical protein